MVSIKGIAPLLMHSFPMQPIEALEKKPPEEQCRLALYANDAGIFVPGLNVQRAVIAGAGYSKGRGRASLQKPVAACVLVAPEHIPIVPQDWKVDARPVVIPATRGRVMRYRPRFDEWALEFEVEFDPDLITEAQLRRVLDDTGSRVGVLDFRPEKRGPFGRFMVTEWTA
jgi:hypothetical protein